MPIVFGIGLLNLNGWQYVNRDFHELFFKSTSMEWQIYEDFFVRR